jgi:uncharacterized protein YjiS (DUF1127 family)
MFHVREFAAPVVTPKPSFFGMAAAYWKIAAWPLRVFAARHALAQLGAMDDRELADVGLCRQDLRDATALRLRDDPTEMFAARAHERHRSRLRTTASVGVR